MCGQLQRTQGILQYRPRVVRGQSPGGMQASPGKRARTWEGHSRAATVPPPPYPFYRLCADQ